MRGLRRWAVAAARRSWGQPDLGDARKGGKQPRQRRDGPAPPDGPGPASETERRTSAGTSGGTPASNSAGSNLVDLGRSAVHACLRLGRGDSRVGCRSADLEATGKGCGVPVARLPGNSWAPIPSTGRVVNVGTARRLPFPPAGQAGGGQARRRLVVAGWDGASVVVRGRESRPHGQGRQQVRSLGAGRPGGRW
jgi:hypothetical protein